MPSAKKRAFCGVLLLLLTCFQYPLSAQQLSNSSTEYFEEGMLHLRNHALKSAIVAFKNAIEQDRDFAEAYYQLACAHMAHGTIDARIKATFALKRALRLDQDNIKYKMTLARLLIRKKIKGEARSQLESVLQLEPSHAEAFYRLGRLEMEEINWYQNTISPHQDIDFQFKDYTTEHRRRAISYFEKAIAADPAFVLPYCYHAFNYIDADEYNKAKSYLHTAVRKHSQNSDLLALLGLVYHHEHNDIIAGKYFQKALQFMPPDEARQMQSPLPLLSPAQQSKFKQADSRTINKRVADYWRKTDPVLLTPINERLLEHYSRVIYIKMRYGDLESEEDGWQTDRGKTYLRYGAPEKVVRKRASLAIDSKGTMPSKSNNILQPTTEQWKYSDFSFTFADEYMSGNYNFERTFEPNEDSKLIFDRKIESTPEIWDLFETEAFFSIPLSVAQFQGKSGQTRVELYFALPAENIILHRKGAQVIANYHRGLFAFDAANRIIYQKKNMRQGPLVTLGNPQGDEVIIDRFSVALPDSTDHFTLETLDDLSQKSGRISRKIDIRTFPDAQLAMSDILLANDIAERRAPIYGIGKFRVIPNIYRSFKPDSIISVYFEIYNLQKSPQGLTDYTVEAIIRNPENQQSALLKFFRNMGEMLGNRRLPAGEISTIYRYRSQAANVPVSLSFTLDESIPGSYHLTLRCHDKVRNSETGNTVIFTLAEE